MFAPCHLQNRTRMSADLSQELWRHNAIEHLIDDVFTVINQEVYHTRTGRQLHSLSRRTLHLN